MDLTLTLKKVLPTSTFKGKNGEVTKQEFVCESNGEYPKTLHFISFKNLNLSMPINTTVKVFFEPQSREYNGKYYTDLMAWKIEHQAAAQAGWTEPEQPKVNTQEPEDENLPF